MYLGHTRIFTTQLVGFLLLFLFFFCRSKFFLLFSLFALLLSSFFASGPQQLLLVDLKQKKRFERHAKQEREENTGPLLAIQTVSFPSC